MPGLRGKRHFGGAICSVYLGTASFVDTVPTAANLRLLRGRDSGRYYEQASTMQKV